MCVPVSEERSVLIREQGNRMYAVWVYFLARTSIEIVPTFLCSFGLALICFWMIGQTGSLSRPTDRPRARELIETIAQYHTHSRVCLYPSPLWSDPSASGSQFGKFMFLLVLLAYAGQGIGLIVSCGIASRMLAMIVTPLAIAPFILFTPYSTRLDSIPGYFRPFQVGSPFWVSLRETHTNSQAEEQSERRRSEALLSEARGFDVESARNSICLLTMSFLLLFPFLLRSGASPA